MRVQLKTVLRVPTDVGDRTDVELERRARASDVDAFGELVQRYCAAVAYVIGSRVGDPVEAERRVIEVFCATWRDLQRPLCSRRGFVGVLGHALAQSVADLDPPAVP
ncbi:hypothetical protein [Amycolatopsis sp. NPDC004625]|uniref:RNA polymerase sigma factor n=1 Tax=Amycolatopsis sp. NPDC004625 TaxID=3154670 RepID=UPI0033B2431C